jgi:hypothetical protein
MGLDWTATEDVTPAGQKSGLTAKVGGTRSAKD